MVLMTHTYGIHLLTFDAPRFACLGRGCTGWGHHIQIHMALVKKCVKFADVHVTIQNSSILKVLHLSRENSTNIRCVVTWYFQTPCKARIFDGSKPQLWGRTHCSSETLCKVLTFHPFLIELSWFFV